jgi:hypothetical protein
MKKTVIKRRKRVPAAAGGTSGSTPSRMTDQAAAETLVSVGRLASGNGGNGEESDGEAREPKRKRTRRSRATRASEREDEDVTMDGVEESESHGASSQRKKTTWDGRSVSPQNRAPSRSDYLSRGPNAAGPFAPTGSPHSGFEIPPLAVLSNSAAAAALLNAQSSYMRSGSNAPSRTHSPLGHAAGYPVPPGPPQFYAPDLNMLNFSLAVGNLMGIPTLPDLERHYMELSEHRRRMEEMLERTDRVMAGVKRGIDEMRSVLAQQQAPPMGPPAPAAQPVPAQEPQPQPQPQPQVQEPSAPQAAEGQQQPIQPQPQPQPQPQSAVKPEISATNAEPERVRESVWPIVADVSRE